MCVCVCVYCSHYVQAEPYGNAAAWPDQHLKKKKKRPLYVGFSRFLRLQRRRILSNLFADIFKVFYWTKEHEAQASKHLRLRFNIWGNVCRSLLMSSIPENSRSNTDAAGAPLWLHDKLQGNEFRPRIQNHDKLH